MSAALKKGWCPGALRPMMTGDGLLLRVRPSAGRLTLGAAAAIADLSARFGNGILEISQRANLQLRGIAERDLPAIWETLAAFGLIDADPDVEAIRNIVASPLSDVDPEALCDVAPHVAALEARLAADARLRALPAKFGFLIDGGGRFGLSDVGADVMFRAVRVDGVVAWAVMTRGQGELGIVALESLAAKATQLALAEVQAFSPPLRGEKVAEGRMRGGTIVPYFAMAPLSEPSAPPLIRPSGTFSPFHGEKAFFLLAPGFGRMRAQQFAALIDAAKSDRAETLRLTTSRQIAIVGHPHSAQEALTQNAKSLGFLTDPADPRLRIVACAGKPACASAARDVQADALALADILPRGGPVALHVSGCAKGCARGAATPITLIAREDGYDVVFDGRADAMPATHVAHLAGARALIASRLAAP